MRCYGPVLAGKSQDTSRHMTNSLQIRYAFMKLARQKMLNNRSQHHLSIVHHMSSQETLANDSHVLVGLC